MKDGFSKFKESAKSATSHIGKQISTASTHIGKSVRTALVATLDQDGDGKLDQEDVRIVTEKGVALAKKVTEEIGVIAKGATKSDLVKEAAAGAMVGAAVAVPVPLVGPVVGATVGATLGTYKSVMKDIKK